MERVVSRLIVDEKRMRENLSLRGDSVLAEPAYLLLALAGEAEAHEVVRRATLRAEREGLSLKDALCDEGDVWERLSQTLSRTTGLDADAFFAGPENYLGRAVETAEAVFDRYESRLQDIGTLKT
jgi:adenylosuccinate lyase